jgi:hypothetical protein
LCAVTDGTSVAWVTETAPSDAKTILSPFRADLFVSHATWIELVRILNGQGGGSYGLSGPRGAGKSWMMGEAIHWAESQQGLGVWFPSPSEYEATAFLAALSDVTATRFEHDYDRRTGRTTRLAKRRLRKRIGGALGLLIVGGIVVPNLAAGSIYAPFLATSLGPLAVSVAVAVWLAFRALSQLREDRSPAGRVRHAAEELRQQVRFIVTTKESSEFGGDASQFGLTARLRRAREQQLVERPATLSSLIHNFRAFAESVADVMGGPVVIAVDELDKMSDPAKVAGLLRDIKGVFEIPGVYFLVSLSDEAARSLSLGALRTRDEFNSSFYTVLTMPPLSPQQTLELLRRRDEHFDEQLAKAFGVLSGGIPREIVRLGDAAWAKHPQQPSWQQHVVEAMQAEAAAFVEDVLADQALQSPDKLKLWRRINDIDAADASTFADIAWGFLNAWNLNDDSTAWQSVYQEQWRRLILRLTIAGLLIARSERPLDGPPLAELQRAARTAASAAVVARAKIAEYVTGELCARAIAVDQLDDQEVELALFVLTRRGQSFGARDRMPATNGAPDTALDAFLRYGILEQEARGDSTTWKLTDAAAQAIPRV